jgi:DNA-binding LacI/PurR family transcriptional regulator
VLNIKDVAAALNVSKATVSRAITGNGRVSESTRQRVLLYMERNNFKPNSIAQSLSNLRTGNIAVALPLGTGMEETPFFMQCLTGISAVARGRDMDLIVVDNVLENIRRIVLNRKVDGVIVTRSLIDKRILQYLAGSDVPFVLIGQTEIEGVVSVDNDNRASCRDLTLRELKRNGLRPGLLLDNPDFSVNRFRQEGYMDACVNSGYLEAAKDSVTWSACTEEAIVQGFAALYQQGAREFFCGDDVIAAKLLFALQKGVIAAALPAGADLSGLKVAAYYNSKTLEQFYPHIPVVCYDSPGLGACACRLLLGLMAKEPTPQRTFMEYSLKL